MVPIILSRIVRRGTVCDLVEQGTDVLLVDGEEYSFCTAVQHFLMRPEVSDATREWRAAEAIRQQRMES